ncbi:MAG: hypothetical protein KGN36_21295 [Acidobacteriota bacterium]|nr:hypothetical protein [Acidobacteriota bacterium]
MRVMLVGLLAAGLALAQGGRSGGGGGEEGMSGDRMGGGMQGGMRGAQRQTRAQLFASKLKMNGDQKEELQKIFTEEAQKARPISDTLSRGRQAIGTALLQKKTEEEIQPLVAQYTAVCAQMASIEAETFTRAYALLKPNQQKNAAQAFELLGGIYLPAVGAGRGAGRPRGGDEGAPGRGGRN